MRVFFSFLLLTAFLVTCYADEAANKNLEPDDMQAAPSYGLGYYGGYGGYGGYPAYGNYPYYGGYYGYPGGYYGYRSYGYPYNRYPGYYYYR